MRICADKKYGNMYVKELSIAFQSVHLCFDSGFVFCVNVLVSIYRADHCWCGDLPAKVPGVSVQPVCILCFYISGSVCPIDTVKLL